MNDAGECCEAPANSPATPRWTSFAASIAVFLLGHSLFLGLAVALAGAP